MRRHLPPTNQPLREYATPRIVAVYGQKALHVYEDGKEIRTNQYMQWAGPIPLPKDGEWPTY